MAFITHPLPVGQGHECARATRDHGPGLARAWPPTPKHLCRMAPGRCPTRVAGAILLADGSRESSWLLIASPGRVARLLAIVRPAAAASVGADPRLGRAEADFPVDWKIWTGGSGLRSTPSSDRRRSVSGMEPAAAVSTTVPAASKAGLAASASALVWKAVSTRRARSSNVLRSTPLPNWTFASRRGSRPRVSIRSSQTPFPYFPGSVRP